METVPTYKAEYAASKQGVKKVWRMKKIKLKETNAIITFCFLYEGKLQHNNWGGGGRLHSRGLSMKLTGIAMSNHKQRYTLNLTLQTTFKRSNFFYLFLFDFI